jgi:hypothetical protein
MPWQRRWASLYHIPLSVGFIAAPLAINPDSKSCAKYATDKPTTPLGGCSVRVRTPSAGRAVLRGEGHWLSESLTQPVCCLHFEDLLRCFQGHQL